jgi:amino-acid N-acetyltransferase
MSTVDTQGAPTGVDREEPVPMRPLPAFRVGDVVVHHADETDIPAIVALNNLYAPDGLTLARTPAFVAAHLTDYQVIRTPTGGILGQVALDEYSPSLVELVSLAVAPDAQGRGVGQWLVAAAEALALYPEKIARYRGISRSELSIGRKFCFAKRLVAEAAAAHSGLRAGAAASGAPTVT